MINNVPSWFVCTLKRANSIRSLKLVFRKLLPRQETIIYLSKDFNLRQLTTTFFVGSLTCSTCSTYSTSEKMIYQKSLPQHRTKATKKNALNNLEISSHDLSPVHDVVLHVYDVYVCMPCFGSLWVGSVPWRMPWDDLQRHAETSGVKPPSKTVKNLQQHSPDMYTTHVQNFCPLAAVRGSGWCDRGSWWILVNCAQNIDTNDQGNRYQGPTIPRDFLVHFTWSPMSFLIVTCSWTTWLYLFRQNKMASFKDGQFDLEVVVLV